MLGGKQFIALWGCSWCCMMLRRAASCCVVLHRAASCCSGSAVFLGQGQGHVGQELVQGDVSLRGEFVGEHGGDHHLQALRQDLRTNTRHVTPQTPGSSGPSRVGPERVRTLKLAGSTLSWKACSSLSSSRPPDRSSTLATASPTPAMIFFPCFVTGPEPALRSGQWEK